MTIKILTPEKEIYRSENAKEVFIPTTSGVIGVLPGHEDLISILAIGEVKVNFNLNEGETSTFRLLVSGGLLKIQNNEIIILATEADKPEELVKHEIEEAIKRAEEKIAGTIEPAELVRLEKELRYERFKREYYL